jgi:hypothetical protein
LYELLEHHRQQLDLPFESLQERKRKLSAPGHSDDGLAAVDDDGDHSS